MNDAEVRIYLNNLDKLGSIPGLDSIRELLFRLCNPHQTLKVIHIAGTNGKGSVGAMIESILCYAGYKVGRYASPAVFDDLEIIRLNKHNISASQFASIISRMRNICDQMVLDGLAHPTRFEIETAASFLYFSEEQTDYAIVECGMGGLLDATNVIETPVCSVITSISMDHMRFLGNTLSEIAQMKAGIIKTDCPVVTLIQKPEVNRVLKESATKKNAPLILADPEQLSGICFEQDRLVFDYKTSHGIQLALLGVYQPQNAILAIECIHVLLASKQAQLTDSDIYNGLLQTTWQGRFEIIHKNPIVILDGAHNEDGARALAESLRFYFPNQKVRLIMGVFADKDYQKILSQLIPCAKEITVIETPDHPRALSGKILAEFVKKHYDISVSTNTITEAVKQAFSKPDEVTVCCGSLSHLKYIKEAVNLLQ